MATGDKLVSLDGLKAAYDDLDQKNSDLKSAVTDVGGLPEGYLPMEYLVADGTQYMDLGFKCDQDSRAVVTFQVPELSASGAKYVFGGRNSTHDGGAFAFGYDESKFFVNWNIYLDYTASADTGKHIIDINKNVFSLDGVQFASRTNATFDSYRNVYAFATRGKNSYYYGASRIFDMVFYDNGVLSHHFVPAKKVSDDSMGLYDLVTDTFKTPNAALTGASVDLKTLSDDVADLQRNTGNLRTDFDSTQVKAYVQTEADRVAEKVRNVQTGDTLTFAAVSDMHYSVDSAKIPAALADMRDGVKRIADQVHLDFYACFGDIIYRLSNDGDFSKGKAEAIGVTKLLNDAFGNNPQIRMTGNHDPNAEAATGYFTPDQMNAFTGIYSNMLEKPVGYENGGFGYHDFETQKIRLIVLNTSYYASTPAQSSTQYTLTDDQAQWLGDTLDISDKDGYSDWQIVIFAHIALDELKTDGSAVLNSGALSRYTRIFNAYINGSSWSAGTYTKDYSGKNGAKLAVYFNGHHHAYIIKNLNYYNLSNELEGPLALSNLFVPNALPARDYPSTDGVTYTKTANTAESTAFQIITIDPVNKIVYAHHYGAGIDIILHYGSQNVDDTVTLTTDLDSPTWAYMNEGVVTVSDGVVTAAAVDEKIRNTVVFAKSEADNCIEAWNIHAANTIT